MKKILLLLIFLASCSFAAFDINKVSKEELMQIKGIGAKKAMALIEYRKTHDIKDINEITQIKGYGKALVSRIQKHIESTKTTK